MLKKGDKVIIRRDLAQGYDLSRVFVNYHMAILRGRIATIEDVHPYGDIVTYELDITDDTYVWDACFFEIDPSIYNVGDIVTSSAFYEETALGNVLSEVISINDRDITIRAIGYDIEPKRVSCANKPDKVCVELTEDGIYGNKGDKIIAYKWCMYDDVYLLVDCKPPFAGRIYRSEFKEVNKSV